VKQIVKPSSALPRAPTLKRDFSHGEFVSNGALALSKHEVKSLMGPTIIVRATWDTLKPAGGTDDDFHAGIERAVALG